MHSAPHTAAMEVTLGCSDSVLSSLTWRALNVPTPPTDTRTHTCTHTQRGCVFLTGSRAHVVLWSRLCCSVLETDGFHLFNVVLCSTEMWRLLLKTAVLVCESGFFFFLCLAFPSVYFSPSLQCSSTCAGGFQRRVVVCQDANGRSNSYCDERVKPAESKSCDSGPCPLWNYGVWGEVGLTTSTVSIRLFLNRYRSVPFPLSVHSNLRRGTEDSPRGLSEAQWSEAK